MFSSLALASCRSNPGPKETGARWTSIRSNEAVVVAYEKSVAEDANLISQLVQQSFVRSRKVFPEEQAQTEIAKIRLKTFVYAKPTTKARPGRATLETKKVEGEIIATLHILAPSMHPKQRRTMIGEAMDENYVAKAIAHEIFALCLEARFRSKAAGWPLKRAPEWFFRGAPEYLALQYATDHSKTVTFKKYFENARMRPPLRKDPNLGGALKVAFLAERYGWKNVRKLIISEKHSFKDAMAETFGLTELTLEDQFRTWLMNRSI